VLTTNALVLASCAAHRLLSKTSPVRADAIISVLDVREGLKISEELIPASLTVLIFAATFIRSAIKRSMYEDAEDADWATNVLCRNEVKGNLIIDRRGIF
jgi:hypothetical protein